MSRLRAGSPGKFLVFLVVVAVVFAYIAAKWEEFNQQGALQGAALGDATATGDEAGQGSSLDGWDASGDQGALEGTAGEETGQAGSGEANPLAGAGGFADLRVERQAIYDRQVERLQAIANNANASASAREQAQQALVQLTQRQGVEQQIEQLIRSKGYEDAVVFVYDQAAIVVLKADRFQQADAARVADIVRQVTGIGYEGIRIVARDG
ncbi:MAG: SpoIIIAH-like family protein [Bacillota bacterium]|nr:MAG: SpoIIIAH-like family protein [Bacillota bacterium]